MEPGRGWGRKLRGDTLATQTWLADHRKETDVSGQGLEQWNYGFAQAGQVIALV